MNLKRILLLSFIGVIIGFALGLYISSVPTVTVLNSFNLCSDSPESQGFFIQSHSDSKLVFETTISKETYSEVKVSNIPFGSTIKTSQSLVKIKDNVWKVEGDGKIQITVDKTDENYSGTTDSEWIYTKRPELSVLSFGMDSIGCRTTQTIRTEEGYVTNSSKFVFIDRNGSYERFTSTLYNNEKLTTYVPSQSGFNTGKVGDIENKYFSVSKSHTVGCNRDIELTVLPPKKSKYLLGKTHASEDTAFIWVGADRGLYNKKSTWVHEYIHTRQCYEMGGKMKWFSEGSATYYTFQYASQIQTPKQSENEFSFFNYNYTESALAYQKTWKHRTEYKKGAKLILYMDYQLQRNGSSVQELSQWLNKREGKISKSDIYTYLETHTSKEIAQKTERYIVTKQKVPFKQKYVEETSELYTYR